jgi:hypothetical protein
MQCAHRGAVIGRSNVLPFAVLDPGTRAMHVRERAVAVAVLTTDRAQGEAPLELVVVVVDAEAALAAGLLLGHGGRALEQPEAVLRGAVVLQRGERTLPGRACVRPYGLAASNFRARQGDY